jgi:hypothetical protein
MIINDGKLATNDRQVRQYKLQPREKQLSFKAWLRKQNELGESIITDDVESSVLMQIPKSLSFEEKEKALDELIRCDFWNDRQCNNHCY